MNASNGKRAPDKKVIVHYCAKCGAGMQYVEKSMLYIYDVKEVSKGFAAVKNTRLSPAKVMAINLCRNCRNSAINLVQSWVREGEACVER